MLAELAGLAGFAGLAWFAGLDRLIWLVGRVRSHARRCEVGGFIFPGNTCNKVRMTQPPPIYHGLMCFSVAF